MKRYRAVIRDVNEHMPIEVINGWHTERKWAYAEAQAFLENITNVSEACSIEIEEQETEPIRGLLYGITIV